MEQLFTESYLLSVVVPTLQVIGHVMITFVVVSVHGRVAKEHRIDTKVIRSMHRERVFAVLGIVLVIAGYILEMSLV